MPNPYDILGVGRGATREEVTRAYRARAKKSHPDAGGSETEFALVKLAADTLKDPGRRARFDASGKMEQGEIDNEFSAVVHFVAMALNAALDMCALKQRRAIQVDMIVSMRDALGILLDQSREAQKKMRGMVAEARTLDGRFSNKRGKPDILGNMIRSRITEAETVLRLEADKEKLIQKAIGIVEQHAFRADAPPPIGGEMYTIQDYLSAAMGGAARAKVGP